MKPASPIAVAFREVRHFKPDDWLHCEDIAVRGRLQDWTIPAHRHEGLHQFQLLERGQAQVMLDRVPHRVQAPAALMVAPGCVHAFRYAPDSAGTQVTVPSARLSAALATAPLLAARLPTSHVLPAEQVRRARDHVKRLFSDLGAEFERAAPGRTEALAAHLLLLATWFLREAGDVPTEHARVSWRDTLVQRYRALLEVQLKRHQPLGAYAQQLNVTPDHLSRVCRAATGLSALELLHERLVLEARRLLAYTEAPVGEVARELGFDDPAYFSRFFARRAGAAPHAYRVAFAQGEALPP
ncbi:MAG TPA: helix-turn-helix domain-containing protein [Burkholderiaceae bacterium]|nr:helix-turn-helix domain-containing protein [Burkholderiaceae bacterium]